MQIEVVGYADVDFKDKDDKQVAGTKLHYIFEDLSNQYVKGSSVASVFINQKVSKGIDFDDLLNAQCNADFDQKGKIIGLKRIS